MFAFIYNKDAVIPHQGNYCNFQSIKTHDIP